MFRQKSSDPRKSHLQVTFQATLNIQERYSEQTYVEPRQDQYYIPYGYAPPPERNIQWDWYSLFGFIFPFLLMIIPASISSTGLVIYLAAYFHLYNFYIDLFL